MPKLFFERCCQSGKVLLVVGSLFTFTNLMDVIVSPEITGMLGAKIGVNYLVPLLVSTYSRYSLLKTLNKPEK